MSLDPNTSAAESATSAPQFDFSAAKTPADWIALLTDQANFPFNDTIKILSNIQVNNPDFELDEAQQVVEETHLKNRILRVANNVYLNPAETILRSIQRATVILGLHSLRNLALGVALLSYFVDNNKDEPLLKEVALSIHTAVLTALLAQKKAKILNSEPLVVAGMMYSLGEMLFMFFGGENGKKYSELKGSEEGITPEQALELVGFPLTELGKEFAKAWNLGHTLEIIHDTPAASSSSAIVTLSYDVASNLRKGWQSDKAKETIKKLDDFLAPSRLDGQSLCLESVEKTLEELNLYQYPPLMDYVPLPAVEEELDEQDHSNAPQAKPISSRIKATIQQLTLLISGKKLPDINDVMSVGLKGIYDGVDFDRVLVALLTPDRNFLKIKSILEKEKSDLQEKFNFELLAPEGWLFQHILREQRPTWLGGKSEIVLRKFRNAQFNQKVGKGQFFAAPLILDGKAIGVYFADRQPSARKMDTLSYDAFTELCTSINETIELVRKMEKQKR